MGVVLGEATHAQETVHYARALVAVHGAEFAQAYRQIAVRLQRVFINQDVEWAVHGLHAVFRIVKLHDVEHTLRVVTFVARGLPQLPPRHMGRVHEGIAALDVLRAHPVFHLLADNAAFGMPEDQPRPGQFLN